MPFSHNNISFCFLVSEHAKVDRLQRYGAQQQHCCSTDDDQQQQRQHAGKRQRRREPRAWHG